jgi:hypothetical protein
MARNSTGKALLKASFDLFRQDPQMMWLPIFAAGAAFLAFAAVAAPIAIEFGGRGIAVGFAVLAGGIAANSAALIFQVAVVFAATDRIEGRTPTVRGSIAKAWTRRTTILKWAVLSAIVGTAISMIERRFGPLSALLRFTSALAWSVATFFVLPVLAFEDVSPLDAVRRSSSILKARFGTVARTGLRFGLLFAAWTIAALAIVAIGVMLINGVPLVGVPVVAIGVACVFGVTMFAAVAGIYLRTILYRFATGQSVPNLGVDLNDAVSSNSGWRPLR